VSLLLLLLLLLMLLPEKHGHLLAWGEWKLMDHKDQYSVQKRRLRESIAYTSDKKFIVTYTGSCISVAFSAVKLNVSRN
jgi:hypothetical protein